MNGKRIVIGAALLVMGAMAVPNLVGGGTHQSRADTITPIGTGCPACIVAVPTIAASFVSADLTSIGATGSGFLPGTTVHLAVARSAGTAIPSNPAYAMPKPPTNALITASTDTAAGYPIDVRLPNGQRIQMPGGRITATLYEAAPPCGWYNFWVVGTSIATGRTSYSMPLNAHGSCP